MSSHKNFWLLTYDTPGQLSVKSWEIINPDLQEDVSSVELYTIFRQCIDRNQTTVSTLYGNSFLWQDISRKKIENRSRILTNRPDRESINDRDQVKTIRPIGMYYYRLFYYLDHSVCITVAPFHANYNSITQYKY